MSTRPLIRLYDRLCAGSFINIPRNRRERGFDEVNDLDPPRFIIDEASDLYFHDGRPYWEMESFVVVRPPYDCCWFEAAAPEHVLHGDRWQTWAEFAGKDAPRMYGALETTFDVDEVMAREKQPKLYYPVEPWKWLVFSQMFLEFGDGNLVMPGSYAHFTDEAGKMLTLAETNTHWQWIGSHKGLADFCRMFIDPILLSMSFMACTNVAEEPWRAPPALAKSYAKKHRGSPLHEFRHVRIHSPGGHSGPPRSAEEAYARRRHMVRGHFRHMPEVTQSGRKFNKRLFWVRPHLRGSATEGTITKDYEVTP